MKIIIPYGLTANGKLIHIDDYTKGEEETFCVACGQVLVARQGKIRQWHFAHYSGHCTVSRETELHEVSKHIIQEAFYKSKSDGSEYRIHWQCSKCRIWSDTDITALANKISVEYEPVQGIRSDLFFHEGTRDFAIEIVFTHALVDTVRQHTKKTISLSSLSSRTQTLCVT